MNSTLKPSLLGNTDHRLDIHAAPYSVFITVGIGRVIEHGHFDRLAGILLLAPAPAGQIRGHHCSGQKKRERALRIFSFFSYCSFPISIV
jgi:hypothetical protein